MNFGFRWTLVNRCPIPPKSPSALARAAGTVGPNAGPTSRHAAEIERDTTPAHIESILDAERTFERALLLYVCSGGMAVGNQWSVGIKVLPQSHGVEAVAKRIIPHEANHGFKEKHSRDCCLSPGSRNHGLGVMAAPDWETRIFGAQPGAPGVRRVCLPTPVDDARYDRFFRE